MRNDFGAFCAAYRSGITFSLANTNSFLQTRTGRVVLSLILIAQSRSPSLPNDVLARLRGLGVPQCGQLSGTRQIGS